MFEDVSPKYFTVKSELDASEDASSEFVHTRINGNLYSWQLASIFGHGKTNQFLKPTFITQWPYIWQKIQHLDQFIQRYLIIKHCYHEK